MHHSGDSRRENAEVCVWTTGWLHLAPLAGRGPRRSAAEDRGEGDYPQVRACRESPSPARKMLATSPASGARWVTHSIVIIRESGWSSIPEALMINRAAAAYWIPAYAGMTIST